MVNAIEVMRKQLEDVVTKRTRRRSRKALLKQVAEMDKKLFDVEAKLLEPAQMTTTTSIFQQAYRVYMNLNLAENGEVGSPRRRRLGRRRSFRRPRRRST